MGAGLIVLRRYRIAEPVEPVRPLQNEDLTETMLEEASVTPPLSGKSLSKFAVQTAIRPQQAHGIVNMKLVPCVDELTSSDPP